MLNPNRKLWPPHPEAELVDHDAESVRHQASVVGGNADKQHRELVAAYSRYQVFAAQLAFEETR